jgi:nucleotide-binding universal stress UspA family protein
MINKILVAVDLSKNSLKAVDYVADIMSCHSGPDITLLNVIREVSEDLVPNREERRRAVEASRQQTLGLMEEASKRLTWRGVPAQQIHLKIQVCDSPVRVAELILLELEKGGYGTVVIGRRGISKREEFLFGSVSNKIVHEARNCAVWVVE